MKLHSSPSGVVWKCNTRGHRMSHAYMDDAPICGRRVALALRAWAGRRREREERAP